MTTVNPVDLSAYPRKDVLTTKGDIYVATASGILVRRGVGANGTVLTADSAEADGVKWASPGSSSFDPVSTIDFVEDFVAGNISSGQGAASGLYFLSGTTTWAEGEANHPGILNRSVTTSAQSAAALYVANLIAPVLASDLFDCTWIIRQNQVDADTTFRVGMLRSLSGQPTDGVYFESLAADGTKNWYRVTRAGGTQTRTSMGVLADAASWYKLRVRRIDASTVGFTINGGTEVTETANDPTTVALTAATQLQAASGTKSMDHDLVWLRVTGITR
jgi:hypothetical protein